MAKKLFITADDYGVHDVIDNGIIACVKSGALNCIDIIVTHHSSEARIKKLMRLIASNPRYAKVQLGLHLTTTCGAPQLKATTDKERAFLNFISKAKRSGQAEREFRFGAAGMVANIDEASGHYRDEMRKEMEAQCATFKRIVGKMPVHMSSHIGVYNANAIMYNMSRDFCAEHGIYLRCPTLLGFNKEASMRRWLDDPKPHFVTSLIVVADNGTKVWKWVNDASGQQKHFWDDLTAGNVKSTEHFIEHFFSQKRNQLSRIFDKLMDKIVAGPERSYEMVVHPVDYNNLTEYQDLPKGIAKKKMARRKKEMNVLTTRNIPWEITNKGIDVFEF